MNTKTVTALGVVTVLAFNAGAVVGYLYAKSKLEQELDERLTREVAAAKRFYSRLHKREENDMPTIVETEDMLPVEREAAQAMQRYQGNNTLSDMPKEEPIYARASEFGDVTDDTDDTDDVVSGPTTNNVFDAEPDMGVAEYEALIRNRTEEAPYVITLAEFMNNEYEHEQDSLVYFRGDGILVDEKDEVIGDPDMVVGDDNLVKFGHFSGDPKAVYVRNDALGHDFHITAHDGTYAFVVHGLEPSPSGSVNTGG